MSAYSAEYISREKAEQMMISKLSEIIGSVSSMDDGEIEDFLDKYGFLTQYQIRYDF